MVVEGIFADRLLITCCDCCFGVVYLLARYGQEFPQSGVAVQDGGCGDGGGDRWRVVPGGGASAWFVSAWGVRGVCVPSADLSGGVGLLEVRQDGRQVRVVRE